MDFQKYNHLKALAQKAYCKYSNFSVSCLIELKNKKLYHGVNVENFSYGATICAERTALINAYLYTKKEELEIKTIYLFTNTDKIYFPCGLCLQMIKEFVKTDCDFIIYNNLQEYKKLKFSQLFPFSKVIKLKHVV